MKNAPTLAVIVVFSFCAGSSLAEQSAVPPGLTQIPPVTCAGNQDVVIENRYIETSGDGIVVGGNCSVEIRNSQIVAAGYGVLVKFNGTAEITGSTVEGGKAALRVAGNGDIYYESTRIRGRIENSLNGEIEDGGDNLHEVVSQSGKHDRSSHVSSPESEAWRFESGLDRLDLAQILEELGVVIDGNQWRLHLAGDVLFDFDSHVIRPSAATELAKVAHVLRQRAAGEIVLDGHTDSVGSPEYNQKLSQLRAEAVRRWLHDKEAIPLQLMTARGLGELKPVAYNIMPDGSDNPAGRAKNRRVEISFGASQTTLSSPTAAVAIKAGGVNVQGGSTTVHVGSVEKLTSSELPVACAEICGRWPELADAQIECITGALLLGGYGVYETNACLAVDSTNHCKLCWQSLKVSQRDCTKLLRLCMGQ